MTTAYSYIRFSTVEQLKGNSLKRQLESSKKYADENGLELDTTLKMKDLGVSAYKGDNVTSGALGSFIDAVNHGEIKEGSYLLVESLDRLSRKAVHEALIQFLSILNKGIVIVTLSDNKKYDASNINEMDLMYSLMVMSRAHDESKIKSLRIQAAWDDKRDNANKKKITKWAPKWVYLSQDRLSFNLHEDRVKLVKKIFEWSESGLGNTLIIQRLENLGIAPWISKNTNEAKRRQPKRWYISYIQRLLTDRTVLGEFKSSHKNKVGEYVVIKDYYPKIISDELFFRVKHLRESRNVRETGTGAGRKGKAVSNIFSGIIYCGYSLDKNIGQHKCDGDNEKVVYANKGNNLTYLQCARQKSGSSGCDSCRKYWRYSDFEKSFLTHIKDVDISTLIGTSTELEKEIKNIRNREFEIKGKISNADVNISKLSKAIEDFDEIPGTIINKLNENESEKEKLEEQLDATVGELEILLNKKENSEEIGSQLTDAIQLMSKVDGDELFYFRLNLSNIIKQTIEKIDVYLNGKIYGDEHYKLIESDLGKEAAEVIRLNEATNKINHDPFYEVHYKSGDSKLIKVDPNDPEKLTVMIAKHVEGRVEVTHNIIGTQKTDVYE